MATYRVLERSWIGGRIVEPGELVDFTGEPGANLERIAPLASDPEPPKGGKGRAASAKSAADLV